MNPDAIIRRLQLQPHPEGGYYRETFRSSSRVTLPDGRERPASTAIYFFLPAGHYSAWHRVAGDEVWHHYGGGALRLHLLGQGLTVLDRRNPQAVVLAGTWQAAQPVGKAVLCGCTVAPGFEFQDFELAGIDDLLPAYPDQEALIRRFSRPSGPPPLLFP